MKRQLTGIRVGSLSTFVVAMERVNNSWGAWSQTTLPWYRGQVDAAWELVPSIYRGSHDWEYEREMTRDFSLQAGALLEFTPANPLEWLFVLQHFGAPTRLLDWSESYLVALYFAVLEYANPCDCAVWVLDPWSLNEWTINHRSVPTVLYPAIKGYALDPDPLAVKRRPKALLPVAVRPLRATRRIIAQRGMFTIHGRERSGLDAIILARKGRAGQPKARLLRVDIAGDCKRSILRELLTAGVSRSVLFPDPEGLAREISFRYSKDFFSMKSPGSSSSKRSTPKSSVRGTRSTR